MRPREDLITIRDNERLIRHFLMDLILTPRLKALEWSRITKQTPNLKIGYPGQHLASLVVGMEGAKTGARGNDIVDGSEVKSCSRIDQVDECEDCGEKVLRIEARCSSCGSENIARKNDSKWLFAIRNENDLKVLTQDVERIILTLADYPFFAKKDFDTIRFQVFEIWTQSPRCKAFVDLMRDYYYDVYQVHRKASPNKIPAPKNFWPYSFQFYMCNPIKVFSCDVQNANSNPEIRIDHYVEPHIDRSSLESERMPVSLLKQNELKMVAESLNKSIEAVKNLEFIDETTREKIPLRNTGRIAVSKKPYQRRKPSV